MLDSNRSRKMWRRFPVMSKYKKIVPRGNTSPIRLLVSTLSAQVAASPQHTQREGFSRSSESRKKKALSVSHRPTMVSGI